MGRARSCHSSSSYRTQPILIQGALLLARQHLHLSICEPFAFSILGFGDIVLPGLLVAFCLDFDIQHNTWKKKLYYITTLVAYLCG